MPGWAFSLLIGAFVGLILAAVVAEVIGGRRRGPVDRPRAAGPLIAIRRPTAA